MMRVVFMGSPDFAVTALAALHGAADMEVVMVYAQPPRPAGRGKKDRPTPVQAWAEAHDLPVRTPLSLRQPEAQADFAALNADVAVVAAYGLILPTAILQSPRLGCVNIHASRLPRWRGAAPIHRAIMAGDADTCVTLMQMDEGLDTGPVLEMGAAIPITPTTTTGSLHDALAAQGAEMITPALRALNNSTLPAKPQPEDGTCYAAKVDKAEARLDWSLPAADIARKINGLSPFPGAWCQMGEERLKILQAKPILSTTDQKPGHSLNGEGLCIACGENIVELLKVQRAGKGAVSAADFLRGLNNTEPLVLS